MSRATPDDHPDKEFINIAQTELRDTSSRAEVAKTEMGFRVAARKLCMKLDTKVIKVVTIIHLFDPMVTNVVCCFHLHLP
jgi:hypothetical protein